MHIPALTFAILFGGVPYDIELDFGNAVRHVIPDGETYQITFVVALSDGKLVSGTYDCLRTRTPLTLAVLTNRFLDDQTRGRVKWRTTITPEGKLTLHGFGQASVRWVMIDLPFPVPKRIVPRPPVGRVPVAVGREVAGRLD